MKFIAPRVSEDVAWSLAERKRSRLTRLLARCFPPPPGTPIPKLERVWVPFHVFEILMEIPRLESKTLCISIDGLCGAFALFEMHPWLEDGDCDAEVLPALIDADTAEKTARKELVSLMLRQRGSQTRPQPRETQQTCIIYMPFWIYYYFRRPGKLDIIALDGITGDHAPARRRGGILNAFHAAGEERSDTGSAALPRRTGTE